VDATNRQDWEAWQALHTEDCVRTAPELQEPLRGAPAMRAAVERLGNAFPDYHVALVRAVGQGPWVAALFQARGTMKHALHVPGAPPIPPTHREFRQTWTAFMRLEGDHLAEFHEHYDQTDLNNQLLGVAGPKSW
jgi:predicted ester cyclase